MENATKALIIAGAILISILIISLGIMVYNQASSTVSESNLDSETIQTYNNQFTMYAGSNQSAASVNSLIDAVNANNATSSSSSVWNEIEVDVAALTASTHYVSGGTNTSSTTGATQYNYNFSSAYTYTVTTSTNPDTGLVNKVTITV